MRILITLVLLTLSLSIPLASADTISLPEGKGRYTFQDAATGQDIDVYYYKPGDYTSDTPIVFVLHGLRRNAKEYRDSWATFAEREQLMVVTPRFDADAYPGPNGFNLGNVFKATTDAERRGQSRPEDLNPRSRWAFTLIERLFTDFKEHRSRNDNATYFLYGHGAGAQFAHRFAMFMPEARVKEIIVGAAGWYTMPDKGIEWPYGTGGVSTIDPAAIRNFLAQPILLLAGGADTATIHTVMRKTPQAQAQGETRVARTRYYQDYAERLAERLEVPFNWMSWVLPAVTHSPSQMTPFAARYIASRAR